MKITRRKILLGGASLLLPIDANAQSFCVVGQCATSWSKLPLGAGGYIVGGDIAPDGTMVCKTDTYGAYIWSTSLSQWQQLLTTANFLSFLGANTMTGVWDIRIAPNLTTRLAMVFLNTVYRSDDSGKTWNTSNLTMTNALANSGAPRLSNRKLCIDPNNADHVFVGLPNGSTPNTGVYETFNFGAASPSWTQVASITAPSAAPGCCGMVFDSSSGTTTVGGHTVTNRCLIGSSGNGIYETTNGGVTWSLTSGSPTLIWTAQIGPTGSYYAAAGNSSSQITVYSYVSGTWTAITPSGFANGFFASFNGGTVCADPNNAGHLTISGPNGGWYGYNTTNADSATPTWTGSTGGKVHTQLSPDIPWQTVADTTFASIGDMVINPVDGLTYFFEGIGVWKFTSQIYNGPTYNVSATSISLGIEQLVSNDFISSPGAPHPVWLGWDRSVMNVPVPSYPSTYFPEPALTHAWQGDYASDDPSFMVALIYFGSTGYSASSNNYGASGSWTAFTSQPTAAQGGAIACASSASGGNIVAVVAGSGVTPVYTKNGGSSWSTCSGLPSKAWINTLTTRARVLAADRVNIGTFYAYDQVDNALYSSTDGGATFSSASSGVLPGSSIHSNLIAIPGKAGHLWFVDGTASMWRSQDGGVTWTKLTSCTVGSKIAVGKTAPGATYPTLFLYGTWNGVAGVFRSTDQFATATLIGVPTVNFPTSCQLDFFTCMVGDMNTFGTVYMGANGSGACYGFGV